MGRLTSHWPISVDALDEEEKGDELRQYSNNNNNNNNNNRQHPYWTVHTHIPENIIIKAQHIHHGGITRTKISATLYSLETWVLSCI